MKVANVEVFRLDMPLDAPPTPHRPALSESAEVANPLSGYDRFKRHRDLWYPKDIDMVWCKITLADGTYGLGTTYFGWATAGIIREHLGPNLIGEDALDVARLNEMLWRMTNLYGATGLASYAISALDLALWDAKGKLLGQPVMDLVGGAKGDSLFCYATGNDVDWNRKLGFHAFKLACPFGPADGDEGLDGNEALVAETRALVGPDAPLMLDCWMAFDVDYTVRLAARLAPYKLHWIEECLLPDDLGAHVELRRALPDQTYATGEHWTTVAPFKWALDHDLADVYQPDILWCGGLTVCMEIARLAHARGKQVILHNGGRGPFGPQFSFASPATPWLEYYIDAAPGVSLEDAGRMPGRRIPQDGQLTPSHKPGFGIEIEQSWLVPY